MIILPDRSIPRSRLLMPVAPREWRSPSQAQTKDVFGNENCTYFYLTARLHDGHKVWVGKFDDRDDADAFLFSLIKGSLRYERELWQLPTPEWHPGISGDLSYHFATVTFLTTTGTSNTYNVPSDWNNSNNTVDCLGAGGSGAAHRTASAPVYATGGGGGGYGQSVNVSLTPGGTANYGIGSGGAAQSRSTVGNSSGVSGGDTYFNAASYAAASTGGAGGGAGVGATSGTPSGGAGGSGKGSTTYSGGRGGNLTGSGSFRCGTGGGGAAGINGAGAAGQNLSGGANNASDGGDGDNGTGGAGQTVAGDGGDGDEWQASPAFGSGGGGHGGQFTGDVTAGSGGLYGAGGGGAAVTSNNVTSGAGRQGLIMVTYTPAASSISLANINIAMMGM